VEPDAIASFTEWKHYRQIMKAGGLDKKHDRVESIERFERQTYSTKQTEREAPAFAARQPLTQSRDPRV